MEASNLKIWLHRIGIWVGVALIAFAVVAGGNGCGTKDQSPPTPEEAAQQPPLEAPKGTESSTQSKLPDSER